MHKTLIKIALYLHFNERRNVRSEQTQMEMCSNHDRKSVDVGKRGKPIK